MSSYKTTCIKCGGNNFYITTHNQKSYCFNCGFFETKGEYKQLQQSKNIDTIRQIYTELTDYYHSCLDTPHIRYLHERGIDDNSIQKFKIGYCPESTHLLYLHPISKEAGIQIHRKPFLADRIVFPYFFTDQVTDIRGRDWNNTHTEKYKTCYNGTYFRGAEYVFNSNEMPQDKEETIVITESEIKTILPSQYGIPTWGLPGISNTNRIINHRGKKILCFDNQVNHRRELIAAIKRWIDKIPDIWIATMPLRGKIKQDIDEYILNYGIDAFRSIINAAIPNTLWLQYNR